MTESLVPQVLEALRKVVQSPCSLHEPVFEGNEQRYVAECIQTGWVSSVGGFVDRFERDLADFTGAGAVVATVNGTAALHVALLLAGVSAGDEVIAPALTFVATANAVVNCGATPHFVDICSDTLGMDPQLLADHLTATSILQDGRCVNKRTRRRIAAVVPMHTFGHPCDITAICDVARRFGLPVIEDAAESLGSRFRGQHTGTFGQLGILSFNGNKILTTGGGGAILTDNPQLAARAKHLTTTGKVPHRWQYEHDCHAYNYRMPNINAALGCAQLERLEEFLSRKRILASHYRAAFSDVANVTWRDEPANCRSNFWLNAIQITGDDCRVRDRLLDATNDAGICTRPCWTPLNRLPMYQDCPAATLTVTDRVFGSTINLPSSASLVSGQS